MGYPITIHVHESFRSISVSRFCVLHEMSKLDSFIQAMAETSYSENGLLRFEALFGLEFPALDTENSLKGHNGHGSVVSNASLKDAFTGNRFLQLSRCRLIHGKKRGAHHYRA